MQLIGFTATMLAVAGFAVFLLPSGYLFAELTRIADFRRRSLAERLLWCVALGTPVSLIVTVSLERLLSQRVTVAVMLVVAAAAAALAGQRALRDRRNRAWRPGPVFGLAVALMVLIGLYVVLATVPVESGGRIYEAVAAGDWSVRVPLVDMAIQRGEPLVNPFDGIQNQTPAIRYYYYWYVLCGAVGHAFHLAARPVLTASSVWASWTLVSVAFLLLKYLFRPRRPVTTLRRMCLLALPVSCILGLDLVAIATYAASRPTTVFPELDWWRSDSDFSMAFHTTVLYAPHHAVGMAGMFLAFLLLLPSEHTGLLGTQTATAREKVARSVAAGLCAAAIVGCSTYMALFLALCCVLVLIDRLLHRDRGTLWMMVGAGVLSIGLSVPFLHEALSTTAHAAGEARHHAHALRFYVRSTKLTKEMVNSLTHEVGHRFGVVPETVLRLAYFLGYTAIEAGFFGYVLFLRARDDWRNRGELTVVQRAQWALFGGIGLPALFLNSDPLAGANDLGRHAGVALRLVAVLWAVPFAALFVSTPSYRRSILRHWSGRMALATVILGLSAQVYQAISQRFFLYASNRYWTIPATFPFPFLHETGVYYHDLYYGYQRLLQPGAPPGRVLYNPTGYLNSAPMLYQTRYAVAPEPDCMTAFGGDIAACRADMPAIQQLFGGVHDYIFYDFLFTPYIPSAMTTQAFARVCRRHGVGVVVVSDRDPVWGNRDSFVWHAPVLYGTPRVRFVACPPVPA